MKYIFLVVGLFSLCSCNHAPLGHEWTKTDTVLVVGWNQSLHNTFMDSAIRLVGHTRALKDSTSMELHWITYTVYKLADRLDTLRDKMGAPILNAAGKPLTHMLYPLVFQDTIANKYIQVIEWPAYITHPPKPQPAK